MVTVAVRPRIRLDTSAASVAGLLRRRPELLVAAGLFGLLMATAGRYGWFIDELYFIGPAAGQAGLSR